MSVWYAVGMAAQGNSRHTADPDIAQVAALISDTGRAAMILALLDGGELPATELALRSGTSPQAASAHLRKLVEAEFITVRPAGRQRLFRLSSPEVANVVETLSTIAKRPPVVGLSQSEGMRRLRDARSCYDHMAGRLGVMLTDHFVERGALRAAKESFELTPGGERYFARLGVDVDQARASRRSFARACMDWTERRPHLAGSLGASLLELFLTSGWVARSAKDRGLRLTPQGRVALSRRFHITL